jgi:hypothetical protein
VETTERLRRSHSPLKGAHPSESRNNTGPCGTTKSPDTRPNEGTGGRHEEEPKDDKGGGARGLAHWKDLRRKVTFRMSRIGKRRGVQQTAVLTGYVRAAGGRIEVVRMRALLDSGAEGEFIT